MSAQDRLGYHQKHSGPLMQELHEFLRVQRQEFEPNSTPGAAIEYMLKRWTELTQFLHYAHVPLDNNLTERALKLIIQTRKSSMFYKTWRSAKISSHIQTALYSAAQNDINPCTYMETILKNKDAVIKNPNAWLPWKYQKTLASLEEGKARHEGCIRTGLP